MQLKGNVVNEYHCLSASFTMNINLAMCCSRLAKVCRNSFVEHIIHLF